MKSRTLPKILVVTDSWNVIQSYREVTNGFGTPFVDYVYSGFIDRVGFHRIKPMGSRIGSRQARISPEQAQVFFSKPPYLDPNSKSSFVVIENIQQLLRRKNFGTLQSLLAKDCGVLGILTSPNPNTVIRLESLGLQSWGWTEDSLSRQMKKFNDVKAVNLAEVRFPSVGIQKLVTDDRFRTLVNLAYNSYQKTVTLRKSIAIEDPVVDRVLYELRFYLRRMLSMPVPLETFEKTQEELGYLPLRRRFEYTRSAIVEVPVRIRESIELESPLNLCQSILSIQSPKWRFIEEYVRQSYKRVYIVGTDDLNAKALERQFQNKSDRPEIISPKVPKHDAILQALVIGLTGSLYWDYRVLKSANADRCLLLSYQPEESFLESLNAARNVLAELVRERIGVINSFKLETYKQLEK